MLMTSFIILIVVFLLSLFMIKEKYNPVTCFSGFWLLLSYLSLMGMYGLHVPDAKTYLYFALGVLSFAIGAIIISRFNTQIIITFEKSFKDRKRVSITLYKQLNYKILPYFTIIITLMLLVYFIRTLQFMASGFALNYIRTNFSSIVINNTIERLLWTFIVLPASIAIVPLNLYASYIDQRSWVYIAASLMITIILSICDGGRVYLFFYMIQFAFFTIITSKKVEIRSKFKKYLFLILIAVVSIAMMVFISNERQIEESPVESLYIYFAGCFPFFEQKIYQIDAINLRGFGMAFFFAPITLILMLLTNIGIVDYPPLYIFVQDAINSLQIYTKIGSVNFNAFGSLFYYYYLDAGIVGIIFGSMFFGMFSFGIFKKARKYKSAQYIVLYSMILVVIATSMVRWQLGRTEFFMSLVYIYFVTNSKRLVVKSNKHYTR